MTHEEAIKPVDSAIWEMSEAFIDMPDADVWRRPHAKLLSFGELAAHVAYSEAEYLLEGFASPLIDRNLRYYPYTVEQPVTLDMGAEALYAEVKRIHEAGKAAFLEAKPDLAANHPGRPDWTWGYTLEYMAFHAAYHTGQMYSVRHLLGHETADN